MPAVLGTGSSTSSPYIVPGHANAVVGYNASTRMYTVFNPWGVNGGTFNGYHVYGLFQANAAFLANNYDYAAWSGAGSGGQGDDSAAGLALTQAATEKTPLAPVPAPTAHAADSVFATFTAPAPAPAPAARPDAVLAARHAPAADAGLIDLLFADA
jgi:hypothetical protein